MATAFNLSVIDIAVQESKFSVFERLLKIGEYTFVSFSLFILLLYLKCSALNAQILVFMNPAFQSEVLRSHSSAILLQYELRFVLEVSPKRLYLARSLHGVNPEHCSLNVCLFIYLFILFSYTSD